MSTVVIHGIPGSPYVRMPLLACEEKGAPYQLAVMQMGQTTSAEHLARHPFGRIPAMEHDGFWLYEAAAIIRYVDQGFAGTSLTPSDAKVQARMNQVMGIVDWYVMPSISAGIGWNRVIAPRFGLPVDEAAVANALSGATTCIRALEQLLGSQAFMAGKAISLADLMLFAHLDMFPMSAEGAALMKNSPLLTWLERMRARPSAQATEMNKLMGVAV